ncbi:hypothetical protein C8E05_1043 [Rhodococcus wratislaviensis]|uniref:Uncharacterized protein n=2 Tax=Rhodococcus wratislaviensis TaxID=44752 RepID=A0AB38F9B4_RHOWR|nr:hypothetical protein C8E05_1043 [Rhodococcus wratislaviensis]GAF45759.1 hypothetical protein RW1_026_00590 [Rhodococcus wratislaviensis NBRC 100605]SPZ38232.1 Uncharacterised protein [Rhodococcus wratislaviensis]
MVGVAATGVVAVRADRQRKAYTPDEVRARLHERYTRAYAAHDGQKEIDLTPPTWRDRVTGALRRFRRRGTGTDQPRARRIPSAS